MNTVKGSIFSTSHDVLVCPVNCIPGVMGAGLALTFANRWSWLKSEHRFAVQNGMTTGKVWLCRQTIDLGEPKEVLLFPTKLHWKNPSKIEWIIDGLRDMMTLDKSFAIPMLGGGLGGLKAFDVVSAIEETVDHYEKPITLYLG